jgi:hypothetical protein
MFVSCFSGNNTGCVVIINHSKVKFDSVHVYINNYKLSMQGMASNDSLKNCFSKYQISAGHDVVYHFDFFVKDSVVKKETIYSNDLGYVPSLFKIKVNSNLEIKMLDTD